MARGTKTFEQFGVPLFGECTIEQQVLGTDILTIMGASGQTGDFLVFCDSAGTEKLAFGSDGQMIIPNGGAAVVVAAVGGSQSHKLKITYNAVQYYIPMHTA